jgi:hypothetical protein
MENNESLALGHAMAELAGDNAGEDWKEDALAAFISHARAHKFFTTEEVRLTNPDLPLPPDNRAWGAVARRAAKDGIVESVGWTRAKSRTVHGMVVTQWASLQDGANK